MGYVYGQAEAVFFHKGGRIAVHIDEVWDDKDPAAKEGVKLGLLGPDPVNVAATVEQATSAPGEKRSTSRRRAPK